MYKNDIELLKQGMLNEVEGAEFYRLAASKAPNEESRTSLMELADEEMRHFAYLKSLAEKLSSGKEFNEIDIEESDSPGIFDWGKVTGVDLQLGVSIYSVAMQMELKSMNYYLEAKEKAENESTKKLLQVLADWEKVHYDEFQKLYDIYKNQWWDDMSYAPF